MLKKKSCNNGKTSQETTDLIDSKEIKVKSTSEKYESIKIREKNLRHSYSWVPPGITPIQIEQYFSNMALEKIPRLGSEGEVYRAKQLDLQIPKQDLGKAWCKHLNPSDEAQYEHFIHLRNSHSLDIGYVRGARETNCVCKSCKVAIVTNQIVIIAPKFGEDTCWHPSCFVCLKCKELLVDLTYCHKNNQLYCLRHFDELLNPRCTFCDEMAAKSTQV